MADHDGDNETKQNNISEDSEMSPADEVTKPCPDNDPVEGRMRLTSGNSEELLSRMPDAVKTLRYQQLHAQEEIEEKYGVADR